MRYNDDTRRRETDGKSDDIECSGEPDGESAGGRSAFQTGRADVNGDQYVFESDIAYGRDSVRCYAAASAERDEHG